MSVANTVLSDIRLNLNIDRPDFEEVYLHGYEKGQNNFTEATNPYDQRSQEYRWWREGWYAGFFSEEPLFNYNYPDDEEMIENIVQQKPLVIQNKVANNIATTVYAVTLTLISLVVMYSLYDIVS